MKYMNKKGTIILRDIMFMIIIFGGVISLMSLAVLGISGEYSNTNLTAEYVSSGLYVLGDNVTEQITETIQDQQQHTEPLGENTGGIISGFGNLGSFLSGASGLIATVYHTPSIITNAIAIMLEALQVPEDVALIVGAMITSLIFVVIIFAIISAALRGGKL